MPWEGVFFDAGKREDAAYRFQSAGGRAGRLYQRIFWCRRRHGARAAPHLALQARGLGSVFIRDRSDLTAVHRFNRGLCTA